MTLPDNDEDAPTLGSWQTIGNDYATKVLHGSLTAGRESHAYLFTGPNSVGKHTLALDFARALNCIPTPDMFGETRTKPCGECSSCGRITRAIYPDVRTIDVNTPSSKDTDPAVAKRRVMIGIDLIADLQRDAMLEPFEGQSRVFIIDEANRMSSDAANSLLKTLEEPPPAVHIILTASSQNQLPETIASRCHLIRLRSVPVHVIEEALIERFDADPNDAALLAKMSQGAPGWAISALKDPSLIDTRKQAASRIINIIDSDLEERFQYARDISIEFRRDRDSALDEISSWLEILRDVAYIKHDLNDRIVFTDQLDQLQRLSSRISEDQIASSMQTATSTRHALMSNALPQLALEVMMMDVPFIASSS